MLLLRIVTLFMVMMGVSACSSLTYYTSLLNGQYELLEKRQPVAELIQSKNVSRNVKDALIISQEMRDFASRDLLLPDNNSYRSYADIGRDYALWNVIATKEFSLQAKRWCNIFVGCISYRGYFSKAEADSYAAQLHLQGYDTYVAGAKAYSTLGWFDDPLLNTMLYKSEARRAGIIFHELAHQKIYIRDDSAFNEAFATMIEQEGVRRWFKFQNEPDTFIEYQLSKTRDREFNQLLRQTREDLNKVYQQSLPDADKRRSKREIFVQLQHRYKELKKHWQGYSGYDNWMAQELNNAHLSLLATYYDLVPIFNKLLAEQKDDLTSFYQRVEDIGKLEVKARKRYLQRYQ